MLNDPIGDLLTRVRNANLLSISKVELPSSNMKEVIAHILKKEGFIRGYRVRSREKKKMLEIYLKYSDTGERTITHLERVSKPSRRKYVKKDEIPKVLNGAGICIISTPRGVVTSEEAQKLGIGGEVLCYIW
ncbi:MAG: 30S ribosomal protein S8 [Candidatus Aerophobetes bacterium]|nr:30S ribosomal protein S8 [Candidatus Aerophobetes bacterium]